MDEVIKDRAEPCLNNQSSCSRIAQFLRPHNLPIQQPVKFDLVINMKTAKAAGIKFSRSFLLGATELIETYDNQGCSVFQSGYVVRRDRVLEAF